MQLLLDTNTCIEILRGRNALVLARYAGCQRDDIALSAVVRTELLTGAMLSAKAEENQRAVKDFCALYPCLPFDAAAADIHAQWHAHLHRMGALIGSHDLMIAATALAHGLVVVTHNSSEFSRIEGLTVEDWQV
jgi:tRNA(fMet)-specific endonuclease VapC